MPTIPYAGSSRLIPTNPNGIDAFMADSQPTSPTPGDTSEAAPISSGPIRLAPGRTAPFSRADAQALAALDPRSLQQAKDIAVLPESTPGLITGRNETTGQSYEMQPSARVDRNVLARLYAQGMERKAQERDDAVRAQMQSGAQNLARIPGENAINLAKQQGADKIAAINAEGAIQEPTRTANIAKSGAEVAALQGKEKREQGAFDRTNSPQERQKADAMAAMTQLQASGFDKTTEGRKTMAALRALTMPNLPAEVAQSAAVAGSGQSPQEALSATQEFAADPEVARLIADIQKNKQGIFLSNERWQKKDASRRALDAYVNRYAAAKGVDPEALRTQIESQLIGSDKPALMKVPFGLGD
jgi:hypothetical protein